MKSFGYGLITVLIGALLQFVSERYLSHLGAAPQLLLLLTIAHGFLIGPVAGETMGFLWGLTIDSTGVSYFGMHAMLLAGAGYISGSLRRRVASERPSAQLAMGSLASLYMILGTFIVRSLIEEIVYIPRFWTIAATLFFNVLLVTAVFWILEWWLSAWSMERESI